MGAIAYDNKKYWKLLFIIVPIILVILFLNSRLVMLNLPIGDYIESLDSPNKEYTLKSYLYNGGATVAFSIRVELINKKTKKVKSIYWKYKEEQANMRWINDIIIN